MKAPVVVAEFVLRQITLAVIVSTVSEMRINNMSFHAPTFAQSVIETVSETDFVISSKISKSGMYVIPIHPE